MVEKGSVKRDGVDVRFVVTDTAKTIPVVYRGALPDLFREGKGVVAQGTLGADGVFTRARGAREARRELHAARGGARGRGGAESAEDGGEMIPELGQVALSLALAVALVQAFFPLAGAHNGNLAWMSLARPAAQAQALLVAFAFGCLTWSFVTNDFSVSYVAMHSNSALPLHYRVAGVWGGHEGSLPAVVPDPLRVDGGGEPVQRAPARGDGGARARRHGSACRGLHRLHAVHLEPVRAPVPARRRWPRPESAAAGPGHGAAPADALHGLRRLLGGVLLRGRGAAFRPARRGLGALVAARGPRWPGVSSPSASRSAARGRTTSSAGAAGGSGIRWRTPPSCRGSSAPR